MTELCYTICQLILEMFLFSVLGWCMEVTLKYIQFHHFINRGFLIGPYCPIYGCGVAAVTVIVGGIIGYNGSYAETFMAGFVICGALEYFVSWYMEKMFHARWWDYSQKPMNLNGRIWIGNLILFGVGSVAIIKWINPTLFVWIAHIPESVLLTVSILIVVLLIADNVVSHILMNTVKKEIDSQHADNTEEISTQIHAMLRDHKLLLRRISQAYPNLEARPVRLTNELRKAKKEFKAASKRAKGELQNAASSMKLESRQQLEEARANLKRIEEKFTAYKK